MSSATTIVIVSDSRLEPALLVRLNGWLRDNSHHHPDFRRLTERIPGSKAHVGSVYAATVNYMGGGFEEFMRETCQGCELVVTLCREGNCGVETFQISDHGQ